MSQAHSHLSPVKGERRILGEKTPNACLSPARSPTKQPLLSTSSPKKLLPSPLFPAQKRSIGQVHAEDAELSLAGQGQRAKVQAAAHDAAAVRSTVDHDSRPVSTSTPSDAMHLDAPEQTTAPPKTDTTHDQPSSRSIPSDPETRKQFIQEKASLLRNRLQNAMRHVRDPQFDRRVSELEEHSRKYPRLSTSASGSTSGVQLQQHLEQKYGGDETARDEDDDEPVLSTPRQNRPSGEHREIVQIADEEDETTPTQNTANSASNRPASPTQMVLSSPTYNQTAQTARFDDDRPHGRETTVATSPSGSQRGRNGGGDGDGDAVDGLLKLMGTNTA
ncbi:hypothetical protein BDV18DRAFT_156882 [Aspergillus unguis]